MEKTINQKDLAAGVTDEDIGDILARLHKTDFAGMNTRDMGMHAQVMVALLGKIVRRHDELVKLRDEVETRTRANVTEREEAASLAAAMLSGFAQRAPRRLASRETRLRTWLTLGILPTPK